MVAVETASLPPLPKDAPNQVYVTVKAIVSGHCFLPHARVFQDSVDLPMNQGSPVPDFVFTVEHPTRGLTMFDLGLRKNNEGYPPVIPKEQLDSFGIVCPKDIAEILREGNVDPNKVERVIISHLHMDHIGKPEQYPNAELILGPNVEELLRDTYPANLKARNHSLPAGQKQTIISFAPNSAQKVLAPFSAFTAAVDLFEDGSFYLVDTPGHITGHVAGLARIAPNTFILLAGDVCHNRQCYHPGDRIPSGGMHADVEVARDSVRRVTRIDQHEQNVVVVLSHEAEREKEMPLFPKDLTEWAKREAAAKKVCGH